MEFDSRTNWTITSWIATVSNINKQSEEIKIYSKVDV